MAAKKVGELVKEARTAAGLTQEKLAQKAGEGLKAADISKCERGEADLTASQLKKIAVACGVTQTSLVNAPKNVSAGKTTAAKTQAARKTSSTAAKKTTAEKKTAEKKTSSSGKTAAAKKTETAKKTENAKKTAAAKKPATPAGANTSMKVTATEKKLIEAYRGASSDLKKTALKVLKGEFSETAMNVLNLVGGSGSAADQVGTSLGDTVGNLLGGLLGGKK